MSSGNRLDSIDALRTLAIIFMILCHFVIFLSPGTDPKNFLHFFCNHIIGDFAAPIFLVLVGISQVLLSEKKSSRKIMLRGFIIFVFGMLLSASLHNAINFFDWDILPIIGFSIILLVFLRNYNSVALFSIVFLIVAISPILRQYSGYLNYWGNAFNTVPFLSKFGIYKKILIDPITDYEPNANLISILKGFLLNGYFPIFPWIVFPLIGSILGKSITRGNIEKKLPLIIISSIFGIISGFSITIINLFLGNNLAIDHHLSNLSFYPDSTAMILIQIGVVCLLFAISWRYFEITNKQNASWKHYFNLISRYSLSIYVIHQILIFGGIKFTETIYSTHPNYYENTCTTHIAFALGIIFLCSLIPILKFWNSRNNKYSLEWFLHKI